MIFKNVIWFLIAFLVVCCASSCTDNKDTNFVLRTVEETHVDFSNDLTESDSMNYFTYSYLYMGGGVAIGDFNNDGLEDIFFTANQENNKLYINQGDFQFKDITNTAGVAGDKRWYTGVSLVDINSDGWLDIYLSVAGAFEPHQNQLLINNGDLTFTESADSYGIADAGYSYQGTFFDYDVDGDLDLLVINYSPTKFGMPPAYYKQRHENASVLDSDHLYENVNGTFIDKTIESGLLNFGLTISSSISDYNLDGLPDIFLCNDFASSDFLYLNNGDKTFKEVIKQSTKHTSLYSMGSDAADINNDGLIDLIQLDMNSQDNFRNKANMASMNIPIFWEQVNSGLHYQYMRNTMQVNMGIVDGIPMFSDIAQMSGLSSTDWSWSVLALDVDNDAAKDLFITNGIRRDINNKDFFDDVSGKIPYASNKLKLAYAKKIPSQAVPNYLYKNANNLKFKDISKSAGIDQPSFSNGMAYADLDNDGDLDLVVNNIDQKAFIYENTISGREEANYLQIDLEGSIGNKQGIGSKVYVSAGGVKQFSEQMTARGFQSSVSDILHFGLGKSIVVDSIKVIWPDGKVSVKTNVAANQRIMLKQPAEASKSTPVSNEYHIYSAGQLFENVRPDSIITYKHVENDFDDFDKQILLPHKMSQFGPSLATGDLNGDGLMDMVLGGSAGYPASCFLQLTDGQFEADSVEIFTKYLASEDMDIALFDFDGDDDLDIYFVSGGNEYQQGDTNYQDRLFQNNGNGSFKDVSDLLPEQNESGSVVRPFDYDNDGDLDLLIGGRQIPHHYPQPASSYIYENKDGRFEDVTKEKASFLLKSGMVTDASWVDLNGDELIDMVLVGEWMEPVFAFQQSNGSFDRADLNDIGLNDMSGWWFAIETEDLDNDGDQDLILGNLGKNYKYQASPDKPFRVYSNDFDKSGSTDIVLSYEQNGTYYPVRGKQCSSEQIPGIKQKFKDYNSFARADIDQVYGEIGLNEAIELNVQTFASVVLINGGDKWQKIELPPFAQVSSVNDILVEDFNGDQIADLVLVGNLYVSEVETTRNDAGYGCFLQGNGDGSFVAVMPYESGFFVNGDAKKIRNIAIGGEKYIVTTRNSDRLSFHKINTTEN